MRPSGPISLFAENPKPDSSTVSFLVSAVAHSGVVGLVVFGIVFRPRIIEKPLSMHETVRRLELHMPDPPRIRELLQAQDHEPAIRYPGEVQQQQAEAEETPQDSAPAPPQESVAQLVAQPTPAPQTLLQPKLAHRILPEKIPVPTVVIWSLDSPKANIVPPLPKTPTAAVVPPSVAPPTQEINLDKLAIASSPKPAEIQEILPSTTSPVVVVAPQAPQAPAQTTSVSTAEPTPAAIVSLTDIRKQGLVVLPPANETASSRSSNVIASGKPDAASGDHNGEGKGSGTKTDAAADAKSNAANHGNAPSSTPAANDKGAQHGAGEVAIGQPIAELPFASGTVERINMPKDGQFGAVIVGSSLEELYPEAAELWAGRLAYTVYLHVGLSKSWILQYALLPAADLSAGGNAAHLAAPWPFTMVRPNLAADEIDADALMIRGVVNKTGHFEALAVAFPQHFPRAEFVLASLRQWEFRPATQAGQPTPVEVLLIIPEEPE